MERRHLKFNHLAEAVADARQLSHGYERTAVWSLEQNLSHLNKGLQMAFDGLTWGLPGPIRPIMRWVFLGRMERLGSDAVRFRATAPPVLQPDEHLELSSQLAEFERLAGLVESAAAKLAEVHPIFGKINREQWRVILRWHCAHHLSFLVPTEGQAGA